MTGGSALGGRRVDSCSASNRSVRLFVSHTIAAQPARTATAIRISDHMGDSLDAKERTEMHHALHQVLTTVAASGAHRRFGVCQDCTYLGGEMRCNLTSANSSALECLLLGVPIQSEDAGLLCVHFQSTSEHRDSGQHE